MTPSQNLGTVAVTGAGGFLGWHLRVRLRAEHRVDARAIAREEFGEPTRLCASIGRADTLIHLAGVNRASADDEVEAGNLEIAERLAVAIVEAGRPLHLVYGNSIQSVLDNPYGRGKAQAAEILARATQKIEGTFADVQLPNLFGEHGRPHYNSFVATFCSEIAHGRVPQVTVDRQVPLLHAQAASAALIEAGGQREDHEVAPPGENRRVSEVLELLLDFHEKYDQGQIPALETDFEVDLFNTYRSYVFPQHFPFKVDVNADARGQLFETVRMHGGTGQTFVSTTAPGIARGDHFHLRKVERFFVLRGTAEIALRRVLDDEVVRFRLSGDDHAFVDMPTMWVHNIVNIGNEELMTLFWADQLLNPSAPDTYWEPVEPGEGADQC